MGRKKIRRLKRIIIIIGTIIIISSIVIGFMNLSTNPYTVNKYDRVEITYIMWESNESQDYNVLDPEINTSLWIKMIPITENETSGLILGLYNNLIKKRLYFDSGIIWLNRCIDQERDGIDNSTGEPTLTYGKNTDPLFNTCLIIRFKVLDIEKNTFIQKLFPKEDLFLHNIFIILQVIFNIIYSVFPLFLIILFTLLIEYFFRHPIRIKLKIRIDGRRLLRGLLKYGLMVGVVYAIPYIVLGIVNLTLPLEELNLLKTRYDFFIPLIIFFIVLCCIGFMIVYLFLFGRNNKKDKNSIRIDMK